MRKAPATEQSYINHFAICLDMSWSMNRHRTALIAAWRNYVKFLAVLSKEENQETRLTAYTFSDRGTEQCLFYDKDVLRLPDIERYYQPDGNTALIDCAMLAISDLEETATLYGQHSLMLTMLSDGQNNDSGHSSAELASRINGLPGNWTTAAFAPDAHAVMKLKQCGFPAGNISTWDAVSASGVEEVGRKMRDASQAFIQGRKVGVRGWNQAPGGLFHLRDFTAAEVRTNLEPLAHGSYLLLDIPRTGEIREFVRGVGMSYERGSAYYQFTKRETVQADKKIAVEQDGKIYSGQQARQLLGLPDHEVKVSPDHKQGCVIFVQSNSVNRKIMAGTRLLVLR